MVEKFLPKLSQNLLDVLNDEEFYDITIEVEIFQIILRYIYGDPNSKPISKTRHHKTNDNLFLTNDDKNFVTEDAEQSVITGRDELINDNDIINWGEHINNNISKKETKVIIEDRIIYWNENEGKFSKKDKRAIKSAKKKRLVKKIQK
ncbi:unnamed protein product [Rhizophagus irregularis]|nr:unnamed protein product [Rhizophagus irregularis]CAB5384389.1 unnamed protein product [Rhizophagus irregularis]